MNSEDIIMMSTNTSDTITRHKATDKVGLKLE